MFDSDHYKFWYEDQRFVGARTSTGCLSRRSRPSPSPRSIQLFRSRTGSAGRSAPDHFVDVTRPHRRRRSPLPPLLAPTMVDPDSGLDATTEAALRPIDATAVQATAGGLQHGISGCCRWSIPPWWRSRSSGRSRKFTANNDADSIRRRNRSPKKPSNRWRRPKGGAGAASAASSLNLSSQNSMTIKRVQRGSARQAARARVKIDGTVRCA